MAFSMNCSVAILCGGKSTRMKTDKAQLDWYGQPLLSHIISGFSSYEDIFLSVDHESRYADTGLRRVEDILPGNGPLSGLCASLQAAKNEIVFVTTCDAPLVNEKTARILTTALGTFDAVIPISPEGLHPLIAVYRKSILPVALENLREGRRKLTALLDRINVSYLPATAFPNGTLTFANLNTPDEVDALKQKLKEEGIMEDFSPKDKKNTVPINGHETLKKEDYVEPNCVLCGDPYGAEPKVKAVPQQRIVEKLDEYMGRKDYAGAERHLLYWLEEAKLGQDLRGQLTIRNELIGFYRKRGRKEDAFENIKEALKLLEELGFEGTISSGTTYTNAATAYYTFQDYESSIPCFEKARTVYEANDRTDPSLLGGLYNNMALSLAALSRYDEAEELYDKALRIMNDVPGGILEQAITYLNLANVKEAQKGMEEAEPEIFDLLDKAEELLLQAENELRPAGVIHEGYYAFVLESCAPTFPITDIL